MTGAPSDHFNGKTYFNPGDGPLPGLGDLLRWKLRGRPVPWPEHVAVTPQPPPPAPAGPGVAVTWVGHSTFLLQSAGLAVLTDPLFSPRASPVSWAGPRRAAAPGIRFEALPRIDVVLLSHDHYDHCDVATLSRLARRDRPLIVSPLGYHRLLTRAGFTRIAELDWWQDQPLAADAVVTLVPARHWCRRTPLSTNRRLWGGFSLRLGGRHLYFVGDSGYVPDYFTALGRRMGPPDLALIPIGAYEPRWFMAPAHMNPAEAVRVHQEVGARRSLGMHWGTICLTDEGWDQPVRDLEAARGPAAFGVLDFGGSTLVP